MSCPFRIGIGFAAAAASHVDLMGRAVSFSESGNLLRNVVLDNRKVSRVQIGHIVAAMVRYRHIEQHQVDVDAQRRIVRFVFLRNPNTCWSCKNAEDQNPVTYEVRKVSF